MGHEIRRSPLGRKLLELPLSLLRKAAPQAGSRRLGQRWRLDPPAAVGSLNPVRRRISWPGRGPRWEGSGTCRKPVFRSASCPGRAFGVLRRPVTFSIFCPGGGVPCRRASAHGFAPKRGMTATPPAGAALVARGALAGLSGTSDGACDALAGLSGAGDCS
eukprot:scaffold8114_cov258-Pinguiococcus_pyrenoidosus.AAC.2